MRFEHSIDINAPQARAWAVVSDVERWPQRTASITSVQLLNNPPFGLGSEVRIRQPKLPSATWTVTEYHAVWLFKWVNQSPLLTTTATHRVLSTGDNSCRLTLTLDWGGPARFLALLYKGLTARYIAMEAEGMKRAAEAS
jgi:uncharacterized membrane protein